MAPRVSVLHHSVWFSCRNANHRRRSVPNALRFVVSEPHACVYAKAAEPLTRSLSPPLVPANTHIDMLWFWNRNRETLRLETRYDNETSEFLVTIHAPGGESENERFTDLAS